MFIFKEIGEKSNIIIDFSAFVIYFYFISAA